MKLVRIKLRTKYILYVVFLHLMVLSLSFQFLNHYKLYFVLCELVIIVSIILSVRLYRIFISPINLITSAIEMIREKDFNTRLAQTGQIETDALIDVYNKMSDQLREERIKQIEQNFFLEKLIQASPSGIIVLNMDDQVATINPAAMNLLGLKGEGIYNKRLSELGGRLISEIIQLEDGRQGIINLSGNQIYRCYKSYFLDQGFKRYFYIIEEMTREILNTERKAYEKVIRMMSHEINNSIGAVNSFLQSFISYKCQLKYEDQEDFENSLKIAIMRNTRLNKFMSNFSDIVKIPEPKKETIDLNELLIDAEKIFSAECEKRDIKWIWQLAGSPYLIKMDILQMEQVIYNIIKNAIEAIGSEGTISVITENGPDRRLIIRDTGKGIPKEIESRLFTPFFSTKPNGQGIGLTLTKEILINHNFGFSLETHKDGYTEFQMSLDRNNSEL